MERQQPVQALFQLGLVQVLLLHRAALAQVALRVLVRRVRRAQAMVVAVAAARQPLAVTAARVLFM